MQLKIAFFLLLLTQVSASFAEGRPNVVIFLVDDMGPMDTSVPFLTDEYGQPEEHPLNGYYLTPSMDRLASHGIRFETFYANSVCSPTRTSIITGQSSARHKVTQWINPIEKNDGPQGWKWLGIESTDITLPRLLQSAGYHTIHIGKGHFGPKDSEGSDPLNLGFDINIGGSSIGRPKSYYGEKAYGRGDMRQPPHLEAYHGTDTFLTEVLTLEALKSVDTAVETGKPFFLYFSHYAVHGPFNPDPRFADLYKDKALTDDVGEPSAAFATLISGIDKSLGDLLDHLEEIGQAENTLIFFLGDNGSDAPIEHPDKPRNSSAPLRDKKGSRYEGGIRVPFIVAWAKNNPSNALQQQYPVAQNATTSSAFGSVEDLMPTVLQLTGVQAPADHIMDGFDLMPAFKMANSGTGRNHFLMHFPHQHRSSNFTVYREGDWKLIRNYHASGDSFELFNLSDDPYETTDLAQSQPGMVQSLLQAMQGKLDEAGALYITGSKKEVLGSE